MSHMCHLTPKLFGVCSQHYKALQMLVIGDIDKPTKMAKNVDSFMTVLWPK